MKVMFRRRQAAVVGALIMLAVALSGCTNDRASRPPENTAASAATGHSSPSRSEPNASAPVSAGGCPQKIVDQYPPSPLWDVSIGDPNQAVAAMGFDPGRPPSCVIYKTIKSNGNIQYEVWFLGTDEAYRSDFLNRMVAAGYQFDTSYGRDPLSNPDYGGSNFFKETAPSVSGAMIWGRQNSIVPDAIYMYF